MDIQPTSREVEVQQARILLTDARLYNFFTYLLQSREREAKWFLERLDQGQTFDQIFYTGKEFGPVLSVNKISSHIYRIRYGILFGLVAGSGQVWKIEFDVNGAVEKVLSLAMWQS